MRQTPGPAGGHLTVGLIVGRPSGRDVALKGDLQGASGWLCRPEGRPTGLGVGVMRAAFGDRTGARAARRNGSPARCARSSCHLITRVGGLRRRTVSVRRLGRLHGCGGERRGRGV